MKVLVAVDLQNDFINGALGTAEAAAMLPRAERKIRSFEGLVLFTRDTHTEDYLNTREGKALPVPHCIRGSHGWQLAARLLPYASEVIDKPTFGSTALGERLRALNEDAPIESITLIGLCTDICVISNALLLRAYLPEIPIIVDAACCAGVTPESHRTALAAMRAARYGENAAIIGRVLPLAEGARPAVRVRTGWGSTRILDMLVGEQLPRIC